MKKMTTILLLLAMVFLLFGCSQEETYKLEIQNGISVMNEVKSEYAAGEEVTIQLETMSEHYYIVTVNGKEIERTKSDAGDTVYSFTMPEEDVLVKIEDKWVEIPWPLDYETEDGRTYLIMPISNEKIRVYNQEIAYLQEIDGYVLSGAEDTIIQAASKYKKDPYLGFWFQIEDEQLFLCGELIVNITPPEGMEGLSGCDVDHKHVMFKEKLTQ